MANLAADLEKIGKRIGNTLDLPEELRSQLQISKMDELETKILDVLKSLEGIGNIDEIMVGLYRSHGIIQNRGFISNKLYRMSKNQSIESIKGKKGAYRIFSADLF